MPSRGLHSLHPAYNAAYAHMTIATFFTFGLINLGYVPAASPLKWSCNVSFRDLQMVACFGQPHTHQ